MSIQYDKEHLILKRGEKIRFKCRRSGNCCTSGPNVALTVYDVCRIAYYLGVDWRELRGKYIYVVVADMYPVMLLRGIGGQVCIFLEFHDSIPMCRIYPARPLRCRLYPFQPVSPGDPNRIMIDTKCPGVGYGEETDPPWKLLEMYYQEVKNHYKRLYELIFEEGYEPVKALEKLLDDICSMVKDNPEWLNYKKLDEITR